MLRWHVTKRAKRRRGQGPWVSVSIPEMNMGSSLSYTPGQPVLTVWEWAGSIKYVRVQLFRGWDSACDIQVGTKNDGVLDWNVPTLYALRMARQAVPTSFDMKEEESKNEFEKKESKNDQNGEDVNADDEEQKNDDMFDENTPQPRGPVWRIKISDTNNPQIYAYSGRFCIDFFTHSESINPNEKGDRGNRRDGRRGRTSAMTSIDDRKLQRELEIEEQEELRRSRKVSGMEDYVSTLKEDIRIGPTLRYAQVHVCKGCYRVYCEMDRIKRDRDRLKDSGCILNDFGNVISGLPPFDENDPYANGNSGNGGNGGNGGRGSNNSNNSSVLPPEEQKLAQSVAHMLDENCDAGIAALLADADRGMAELLEDLDMVPRKKRKRKSKRN